MEENTISTIGALGLIVSSLGIGFIIGLIVAFNASVKKLKQIKGSYNDKYEALKNSQTL